MTTLLTELLMKQNQQLKRTLNMKTTSTKTTKLLSATALMTVMTFTSCTKESELDMIKDAQMCLNTASPTSAQGCVSKLASNISAQANQLKCSAYFIQEGLGTPTKLIEAIDASGSDSSCPSCSGSMAIISQLKFSSSAVSATNIVNADAAFDVCSASEVAIYTQLASMVNIATLASSFAATEDAAGYATAIMSIPNDTLGSIAIQTFTSSCESSSETNSDSELQQYCGELAEVTASASAADIGACLKYKLAGGANPGNGCPNN